MVSRYHLAVVYACAPDARCLQILVEILVNLASKVSHSLPFPEDKGRVELGLLTWRLGLDTDDAQSLTHPLLQNIQVPATHRRYW